MLNNANNMIMELLSNPKKVIREQEDRNDALILATKTLASISKSLKESNVKEPITYEIKYEPAIISEIPKIEEKKNEDEEEVQFTGNEIINDMTPKYIEYNTFFDSCKKELDDTLRLGIAHRKQLNHSATIGNNSWDSFSSYKDAISKGCKDPSTYSSSHLMDYPDKQILMGITTDFVTNNMLVNKSKYFHFVVSSFNLFRKTIRDTLRLKEKLKLDLIFKGGNLMKFLFESLNKKLNFEIVKWINEHYGEYFKSSDFDFDFPIKIKDMSVEDYNNYRAIILNIMTLFMLKLKDIIINNKTYFFEQINKEQLQELAKNIMEKGIRKILDQENEKLEATLISTRKYTWLEGSIIEGIIFDYNKSTKMYKYYDVSSNSIIEQNMNDVITVADFFVVDDEVPREKANFESKTLIINTGKYFKDILKIQDNGNKLYDMNTNDFIYHSNNTNLQFKVLDNMVNAFSLLRLKHNFEVRIRLKDGKLFKSKFPGELLDISSPKLYDFKFLGAKEENYKQIQLKDINIRLQTQSYQGLIVELMNILFNETQKSPWEDAKYVKRLKRVNLLLFLRVLILTEPSELTKIKFIERLFDNMMHNLNNPAEIINFIPTPKEEYLYNTYFKTYYNYVIGVTTNIKGNKQSFKEFKVTLEKIIKDCLKILKTQYMYSKKEEIGIYMGFQN